MNLIYIETRQKQTKNQGGGLTTRSVLKFCVFLFTLYTLG